MSLLNCPECGHNVSSAAVACPNCGRPITSSAVPTRPVIVTGPPKDDGIPPAAIAVGAIVLVGLIVFAIVMFNRNDPDANSNLSVKVDRDRASLPATSSSDTSSLPPVTTTGETAPTRPESKVNVPGAQTEIDSTPTSGRVKIDAKVVTQTGSTQAVRNERFYLLERSVEEILREARIEPIDGNSLSDSLGLAVVYPERYGQFRAVAMRVISDSAKYSGTTGSDGIASMSGVEPGAYYIFGITKTGRGFAFWSSPVSVIAGDNTLNLSPARITEIARTSGE